MHGMQAFLLLALLAGLAAPAHAIDFFFVTSTSNAGAGTLRQAIIDANASNDGEQNRIIFNIAGGGVKTISPLSQLPIVTGSNTVIDGLTQPGADCTSWPPTLQVQLRGSFLATGDGLKLAGNDHVVRGLVINDFPGDGIQASGASVNGGHLLHCNFIGTNTSGTSSRPNGTGVFLDRTLDVTVGGTAVHETNLISGNDGTGVSIVGDDNDVEGNFIGTDVSGSFAVPNNEGVRITDTGGNTIGGLFGVGGNVIAGNDANGIVILGDDATFNFVIGNWIGVNVALDPIPNANGITLSLGAYQNSIGAPIQGAGNFIQWNDGVGVRIQTDEAVENVVVANAMGANGARGIQFGLGALPIPNDPGDADIGPNQQQNHPDVVGAAHDDATDTLLVWYEVSSAAPHTLFPVETDFYIADADAEEGIFWIGRSSSNGGPETDALFFPFSAATLTALGGQIVATATDAAGNTSEFGPPMFVPEPGASTMLVAGALGLGLLRTRRA